MNSLLVKAMVGLSLMGKTPVESVVVSIDRYETPCKDIVYFFADAHIGSKKSVDQESNDFMVAIKSKKNVGVIAEDSFSYDGDNSKVKQKLSDLYSAYQKSDEQFFDNSALVAIGSRCKEQGVPIFNAECRLEMLFSENEGDLEIAYDKLAVHMARLILRLQPYNIIHV